jgi:hypothetical protein
MTMDMDNSPLIEAMRAQIAATPMDARGSRVRLTRRRAGALSGGAFALAAFAAALVLVLGRASSAPPAYAATLHAAQRTVTITLRQLDAIPALNARLEALHAGIRVVPVVRGCADPVRRSDYRGLPLPGPPATLVVSPLRSDRQSARRHGGRTVAIDSQTVPVNPIPNQTLIVAGSRSGYEQLPIAIAVLNPAPRCIGVG